jgi:PleD family two-component response regulator
MTVAAADILGAKILIVDDQEFDVRILVRILENAGYTDVVSTTQPLQVSTLQNKNRYDLILLDIQMPDLDGFQVMELLKIIATDDSPAVLVITADVDHKSRALESGAKDFISKPLERVEVLTRVHNLLEVGFLQKEIADHKEDNPALSTVIQRNIRKIIQVRLKAVRDQGLQDRIANRITSSGQLHERHAKPSN